MPANIIDVERAGAGGQEIRSLQPRWGLRKGVAGAEHDTAAFAELAEQGRERDRCADAAAAIAATLEAVARRDDEGIGISHPAGERADVIGLNAAFAGSVLQRPGVRPRHEGVIAEHMLVNERAVMGADALQLHGEREG